ncbi:MAG: hypothetical protein Kow0060_22440 [Methylohalobius crimeensis]
MLATAAAAIFSAGCTRSESEEPAVEEPPFESMEQSVQPLKEGVEQDAATMGQEAREKMEAMKRKMEGMGSDAMDGATEVKVACFGINACKGQSDCATPNNACMGMNSCKGQGFKYVSLKECEAQGGKVITPSM